MACSQERLMSASLTVQKIVFRLYDLLHRGLGVEKSQSFSCRCYFCVKVMHFRGLVALP